MVVEACTLMAMLMVTGIITICLPLMLIILGMAQVKEVGISSLGQYNSWEVTVTELAMDLLGEVAMRIPMVSRLDHFSHQL